MKGLIFEGKGNVLVKKLPKPTLMPGSVIVQVEGAGICGSDLHMYAGRWKQPEYVMGHEISGKIVDVGRGVDKTALSRRVCVESFTYCGACELCKTGLYNLCKNRDYLSGGLFTGGFAEYARVPAVSAFPVSESVSANQAVMIEPVAVACRAVSLSGCVPEDFAVVIGGGTIGILSAAVLQARFRLQQLLLVKYDHQAENARKMGIEHIHVVSEGETVNRVKELTRGRMADVVIDTVGSSDAIAGAVKAVRPAGTICLVAVPGSAITTPLSSVVLKEIRLIGSCCYGYSGGRKDFESAIDLVTSGAIPAENLITHHFYLDQAREAFETASDKSCGSIKVVFSP